MNSPAFQRANFLIEEIISRLKLDLSGLTVLTDVGSNYYQFIPMIALKANAKKVFVWCSDSNYGNANEIIDNFKIIAGKFQLDPDRIEFAINSKPATHISQAHIITNTAHIRPIDKSFIDQMDVHSVISLMYEKWEWRREDIDADYCKSKNIRVGGTWENHPDLLIFNAAGNLAQKMIYEAGLEIWQNHIFVWSNDHFGSVISEALKNAGAASVICSVDKNEFASRLSRLDVLFITDYDESRPYFGKDGNGLFKLDELKRVNPNLSIVHLYGDVDVNLCKQYGIAVYPPFPGKSKKMSYTLGHLGLKTIIDLQAAGLKVGELLYKNDFSSDLLQRF